MDTPGIQWRYKDIYMETIPQLSMCKLGQLPHLRFIPGKLKQEWRGATGNCKVSKKSNLF